MSVTRAPENLAGSCPLWSQRGCSRGRLPHARSPGRTSVAATHCDLERVPSALELGRRPHHRNKKEVSDITDFSWRHLGPGQSGGPLETSPGASPFRER